MAYSVGLGDRTEEVRHRSSNPSVDESSSFPLYNTALRSNAGRIPSQTSKHAGARASLPRRFTMNAVPTMPGLSPIGQQRRQAAEQPARDLSFTVRSDTVHVEDLLRPRSLLDDLILLVSSNHNVAPEESVGAPKLRNQSLLRPIPVRMH